MEEVKMNITAQDFGKYLAVQRSGVTNMFDVKMVQQLSGLSRAKILYIMEHYKEPIDVDSICNEIGFSKYYFCKLFKKQQGVTIHQYLINYRITNAKELLAYSKLSINTIATQVGFKNSLTFIRAFERVVNMTPSEYRGYYQ